MTAFMLDLALSRTGTAAVAGLDVAGFLQQPGAWRTVADLVGIGLFTGFFVVPLFALIQSRSPKSEMSLTFAALNIQNSGFIVLASLSAMGVQRLLGWTLPHVSLALAVATALGRIWCFTARPRVLMTF